MDKRPTQSLPLYCDADTEDLNKEQRAGSTRFASYEWILIVAIFVVAYAVRAYKLAGTIQGVRYTVDTLALPRLLAMLMDALPGYTDHRISTTLGALTAPLTYLISRQLECRLSTALLFSLFTTFDSGLIMQSRYILPDTTQFFFVTVTLFLWFSFARHSERAAFSRRWWRYLVLTCLSLGAMVSCKWTGMVTAATIVMGVYYQVLGAKEEMLRQLRARVLCLVVLPASFYLVTQRVYRLLEPSDVPTWRIPPAAPVSPASNMKSSKTWFFLPISRVDFHIPHTPHLITLNPLIWHLSPLSILSHLLFAFSLLHRFHKAPNNFNFTIPPKQQHYLDKGGFILLAWAMHYIPFCLVDLQLSICDYFPALYISLLLLVMGLDVVVDSVGMRGRRIVVGGIVVGLLWSFGSVAGYTYEPVPL